MRKITSYFINVAIAAILVAALAIPVSMALAAAGDPGTSDGGSSASPGTNGGTQSASPATDNGGSSASSPSGSGSPSTPSNPPASGNPRTRVSRGSGGSSIAQGIPGLTVTVAPGTLGTSTCPLITSYMKLGKQNDPEQVSRLQSFLRDSQEIDVDVTGVFDQKTEEAVKTFQSHYLDTVLGPWGATLPSGEVYITTQKKINELACGQELSLDESELSILSAYRQNRSLAVGSAPAATPAATPAASAPGPVTVEVLPSTPSPSASSAPAVSKGVAGPETPDAADSGDEEDESDGPNTAAAGNPSILSRFWTFIVDLFR